MHFFLLIFTSLHHRRIIALASYNLRSETFLGMDVFPRIISEISLANFNSVRREMNNLVLILHEGCPHMLNCVVVSNTSI